MPTESVGRGLLLPYSVGGIIMLGLMISSITTFAAEISHANIVRKRVNRQRLRTLERTKSRSEQPNLDGNLDNLKISSPQDPRKLNEKHDPSSSDHRSRSGKASTFVQSIKHSSTKVLQSTPAAKRKRRKSSLVVLREEKDRFDAMRRIQHNNAKFKQWSSLITSTFILCLLWFLGALVFYRVEGSAQHMSYFEAIYFCFVSLLTIGYGDFAPITNAGRPFFVVWSLLAVSFH